MKNLKIYLEDAGLAATPANTMGLGNPMPPTEGQPGSEPMVPTAKSKKEKCKKCKKTS